MGGCPMRRWQCSSNFVDVARNLNAPNAARAPTAICNSNAISEDGRRASPSAARTRGAAALGGTSSLAVCGASLRHETTAVDTLLTPYRTAVEYGGVSSPGWAGLCRETRPGDRVRPGGRDDKRQDGGKVVTSSCGWR